VVDLLQVWHGSADDVDPILCDARPPANAVQQANLRLLGDMPAPDALLPVPINAAQCCGCSTVRFTAYLAIVHQALLARRCRAWGATDAILA